MAIELDRGEIHRHGATVTDWRGPDGEPALFLSERARFEPDVPIRGGVPIVFPWFGPDPEHRGRPAHGFARRMPWRVCRADADEAVLELVDSEETRALWPHRFRIEYRASLSDELELEICVENRGEAPFPFESALHTYFRVSDVRRCLVYGLEGARYLDKTRGQASFTQGEAAVRFIEETDRTYLGTESTCRIEDGNRVIVVRKSGSRSTIVWNPWRDWAARTVDFGDDEWERMVCVESGNVGVDAVTLSPGAQHRMTVRIGVQ